MERDFWIEHALSLNRQTARQSAQGLEVFTESTLSYERVALRVSDAAGLARSCAAIRDAAARTVERVEKLERSDRLDRQARQGRHRLA